ncbi:MAG: hypothetical protein JJE03_06290 [Peptostreptococcaceae bacterium]|nr:hypothetical protein [Peptostreptococcaceae bacterium]
MALKKEIKTLSMVTADYWRLETINIIKNAGITSLLFNLYYNPLAEVPIDTICFEVQGEMFTKYFIDSNENPYTSGYAYAKNESEFFADAEDC